MFDRYYMNRRGHVYANKINEDDVLVAVIPPEDREQVERFAAAAYPWYASNPRALNIRADQMQAALREFANPTPQIEEPQGLGAVVEDAEGVRWVRIENAVKPFLRWVASDSDLSDRYWERIAAIKVLSEGVTP